MLLSLRGITRTVELPDAPPLEILRGIDLDIDEGDHISIVGRSGSGKSTLLNIIGLIDSPTTGEVWFDEVPVQSYRSGRRDRLRGRNVGFVFQQFNLLPGRTALENAMTPLLYAEGRQFWQRRRIAQAMLERVGLGERLESTSDQLSGGEQQRVAIARALVRNPRLILADEPTGALDVETGARIMELLVDVAQSTGAALVTITHDPNVAMLADRHYRLDRGLLGEDTQSALLASPRAALPAPDPRALIAGDSNPAIEASGGVAIATEPTTVAEHEAEPESTTAAEHESEHDVDRALRAEPSADAAAQDQGGRA